MVFKRENIDFNIFRPEASSVKLNFLTCYISLLYSCVCVYIYINLSIKHSNLLLELSLDELQSH